VQIIFYFVLKVLHLKKKQQQIFCVKLFHLWN